MSPIRFDFMVKQTNGAGDRVGRGKHGAAKQAAEWPPLCSGAIDGDRVTR